MSVAKRAGCSEVGGWECSAGIFLKMKRSVSPAAVSQEIAANPEVLDYGEQSLVVLL